MILKSCWICRHFDDEQLPYKCTKSGKPVAKDRKPCKDFKEVKRRATNR